MVARLERSERRRKPSDAELMKRARALSDRHLGGLAEPESVRWVDNQQARWGSCTPGDRTIRLSARLQGMPVWVVDYVLVHELAHLLEPGHDAAFWALGRPLPAGRAGQGLPAGLVGRGAAGPAARRRGRLSAHRGAAAPGRARGRTATPRRARAGRRPATSARRGTRRSPRARRRRARRPGTTRRGGGPRRCRRRTARRARRAAAGRGRRPGRRPRTPRAPRAGPRRAGWCPRARSGRRTGTTGRALACSVSSTRRASGETTSVLAVRWSGWQPRSTPSGWPRRCVTNRSRSCSWAADGAVQLRQRGQRVGVERVTPRSGGRPTDRRAGRAARPRTPPR